MNDERIIDGEEIKIETEETTEKVKFSKVKALPGKAKAWAGSHKKAIIGVGTAIGAGILAGYKLHKAMTDAEENFNEESEPELEADYGKDLLMKFVDPDTGEDYDIGDTEIKCTESFAKDMMDICEEDEKE